jgi:aminomethyltransferase
MFEQSPNRFQPQPPRPSMILRPGMPALPPGVERYRVAGRGILAVRLHAGDTVTVKDVEGGQVCELVAAGSDGRVDTAGILGVPANADAAGLKSLLGEPGEEAAATRRRLERSGVDLASARALRVFGANSPAGSTAEVVAGRDGILVVGVPGAPMDFDRQDTATPVEVLVRRADPRRLDEAYVCPSRWPIR